MILVATDPDIRFKVYAVSTVEFRYNAFFRQQQFEGDYTLWCDALDREVRRWCTGKKIMSRLDSTACAPSTLCYTARTQRYNFLDYSGSTDQCSPT